MFEIVSYLAIRISNLVAAKGRAKNSVGLNNFDFLLKNRLGRQARRMIDNSLEDVVGMIKRLRFKPTGGADKSE